MLRVLIIGNGKMGSLIKTTALANDMEVLGNMDVPDYSLNPDVVLDFSHPDNFEGVVKFVSDKKCALVYGTTGLNGEQITQLSELSKVAPVFYSANFSYGVAVFEQMLKQFAPLLKEDFDMEVVETHHNQKQDAPSGTAKMLVNALDPNDEYKKVYGREGFVGKREKEIGVHALRGGSVAGIHSVYFFGDNETIEIKHTANSRQIFVNGAIKAAKFIFGKEPGMYNMQDLM